MSEETVNNWVLCDRYLPPEGLEVMTKIDDKNGCRNKTTLKRKGTLWFLPDMTMYVYYNPTHWRLL